MLAIFRRHTAECTANNGGTVRPRNYRRCDCHMHAEGHLRGVMFRRALNTTSWTVAQKTVKDIEARGSWDDPDQPKLTTIREGVDLFLTSVEKTSSRSTMRDLRSALHSVNHEYRAKASSRSFSPAFLEFCSGLGLTTLDQIQLPVLVRYMDKMVGSPHYRAKRIRTLRRFFFFCERAKWMPAGQNPAMGLEKPNRADLTVHVKQPYTDSEVESIRIAARQLYGPRLDALVCLMRYAGLRISDAATFSTRELAGDMILLTMEKTQEPLALPVHPELAAALARITPNEAGYYFWSGASNVTTATDNNRARLVKVFEAAGLVGAHPHRFRHTFAVDLLVRGVDITMVQKSLGHSSVKITERHYLPFIAKRREQLAAALKSAWGADQAPSPAPTPKPTQGRRPALVITQKEAA